MILGVTTLAAAWAVPMAGVASARPLPATTTTTTTEPAPPADSPPGQCTEGQYPVVDGGASNLKVACTTQGLPDHNSMDVETIQDFDNVSWPVGATRQITGSLSTGSKTVSISVGAMNAQTAINDINHAVTVAKAGYIGPGTYITAETSTTITLSQFPTKAGNEILQVENGPGRTIGDGSITTGTPGKITSATANFNANDVGLTVTGTNIPPGDTIQSVGTSGSNTFANLTANAVSYADAPLPCNACGLAISDNNAYESALDPSLQTTAARMVTDISFATGSTTLTSTDQQFTQADVGLLVVNATAKVPKGAFIASVTTTGPNKGKTAVMGDNTLGFTGVKATAAGSVTTIGLPTANAPANGNAVTQLASSLSLNPALVQGSAPCSTATPAGELLPGVWESPNVKGFATTKHPGLDFTGLDLPNVGGQAIAQLLFTSSVVSFAAYVVRMDGLAYQPSGNSFTNGKPDFEIVFPYLPTGIGVCPGTGTASTFSFVGETVSQNAGVQGTGRAGVPDVRQIQSLDAAGDPVTGTASVQGYDWDGYADHAPVIGFNTSAFGPAGTHHLGGGTQSTCTIVRPALIDSLGDAYPCGQG